MESKSRGEFYIRSNKSGGFRRGTAWCRGCHSIWASRHNGKKEKRRRYWLNRYKVAKGCAKCGFKVHSAALDFYHPSGKSDGVAGMMTHPLRRLFAEIRLCVLLCANCHRIEHAAIDGTTGLRSCDS